MSAQPVVASVQIADVGPRRAFALLRRPPAPGSIAGLRQAHLAICAQLRGAGSAPMPGRAALIAFWDDDAALDRFASDHPLAAAFDGGWQATLRPLRIHGGWPGFPDDFPRDRAIEHDGPAVVLTLGRLRLTQLRRFLRASRPAERAAVSAPGLLWGTALARPPFVATCTLWDSPGSLSDYAYGRGEPAHPDAISAQAKKDFHHVSAFIRFAPYNVRGRLGGKNPLGAETAARLG